MKCLQDIIIGVYKITNKITNKYYIGYAKDIYKRFNEHRNTLKNGNHQNIILQRSYNKYTLDAFIFEILHIFDNIENAKIKELEYLQTLKIRPMLYNLHYNNSGGDILTNHPDKENIIRRITNTINKNFSKMTEQDKKEKYGLSGYKNGMFGKTHSEEARKNISKKNKGISKNLGFKHSDEMKKKLSEIAKTRVGEKNSFYKKGKLQIQEKNPNFGKKLSDEAKKKISELNKGKKHIETSKKITIDNINYNSLTEASEKLKIPLTTISYRIRSENPKFDNYKFTDEENIKLPLSTKISINNIVYESVLEASKKLNFTNGYITRRLNSTDEEDSEWKILDIKRNKRTQIGRKVMINDIIYHSVKEASEKLNIIESTLTKRLNSKEPIPVTPKKSVSIDNVIYESVTDASKKLNKNINVLIKYLKSDKFPNYIYLPIEYIDLSKYKYI
jgi:group I intron endonuclease